VWELTKIKNCLNIFMLKRKIMPNSRRAFTLIELLIIVAIMAVLLSVIIVTLNIARTRAKDSAFKTTANNIQTAITSCCISSATLFPIAPGVIICSSGVERYPGAESIGGGSITPPGCNGGDFIVTVDAGTKNSGTYTSATITATNITYNP
jgi:prepilin-type N-terminal cleavage/methylation domain-containing protein